MPRAARIKSEDSVFHVMVRSIKEVSLFSGDKDKLQYMNIVRGYQKIYGFKV